jgi:hypothetical protein
VSRRSLDRPSLDSGRITGQPKLSQETRLFHYCRCLSCQVVVTLVYVAITYSPPKACAQTREQPQYDVVIVNGHIIDGTGKTGLSQSWRKRCLARTGVRARRFA